MAKQAGCGRDAYDYTGVLVGLAVCLSAGVLVWWNPVLLWPPVSLCIGLLCGLAVFGFEQAAHHEGFLGAQRFPPGRVWLVKILCWGMAALLLASLAGGAT